MCFPTFLSFEFYFFITLFIIAKKKKKEHKIEIRKYINFLIKKYKSLGVKVVKKPSTLI